MKELSTYINEQLIFEHIVNCTTKDEMHKYADEVWNNVLMPSYKYCGGIKGCTDVNDLIDDSDIWKLTRKNGKIVCAVIYSTKRGNGRKLCLFGNDQTHEGRVALRKQIEEDFKRPERDTYAGVSGKPVKWMIERGGIPIPAYVACELMNASKHKNLCEPADEYWYKRPLSTGGYAYKIMFRAPKDKSITVDDELKNKLIKQAEEYDKKNDIK